MIAPTLNAHFMAFAAGAMTFFSLHELVPVGRRYHNPGVFASGLLMSALVYALLACITGAA